MLEDISHLIIDNPPRLSYGVAATDIDDDGHAEFVVTGFGTANVVLDWDIDGTVRDATPPAIRDSARRAIGIAAADVNGDGHEELYILNTDTFMGMKRFGDRFFARTDDASGAWHDLFELPVNVENPNLSAGRSVAAIDPTGEGVYRIVVANYGGPMRMHHADDANRVRDEASARGIRMVTGGRSLCVVPDIADGLALFCGNENDANSLYVAGADGTYRDRATEYGVDDALQHARGVGVADVDGDGLLDIIAGTWDGANRLWVRETPGDRRSPFRDVAPHAFRAPGKLRTVVIADFDNDGAEEAFMNYIGEPNRLFRIMDGTLKPIEIGDAAEPDGLGTGAAVADINGDGILELLVAHGEQGEQPLSLFRAPAASGNNWLRVAPRTRTGAPARGAVVTLEYGSRRAVRVIDGGSGYLCQMEPVAHFGLGMETQVSRIEIRWPDGFTRVIHRPDCNDEIEVRR